MLCAFGGAHLLFVPAGLVMPGLSAPVRKRWAEILPLAQVGQDGAGGAVHTIEGIAGVRPPASPQELRTEQAVGKERHVTMNLGLIPITHFTPPSSFLASFPCSYSSSTHREEKKRKREKGVKNTVDNQENLNYAN